MASEKRAVLVQSHGEESHAAKQRFRGYEPLSEPGAGNRQILMWWPISPYDEFAALCLIVVLAFLVTSRDRR
jgi:hypothetical protein